MDNADVANDYIEWRLEQTLKARQLPVATVASRVDCVRCDEPIPAARREAVPGVQLCVECQSMMEGR